jgi:hypothetical protein
VLRRAERAPEKYPWLTQLLARRPFKVVAIALANKMGVVGQRPLLPATGCGRVRRGLAMKGWSCPCTADAV